MPRLDFGDFLNLDSPRGRGRARGRGRGGFQGGRGGGAPRGGGGGRGGRGGRGGFDSSRGRGAGRTVRGGHFGADYSAVALDYSKLNTRTYHKFEPSVKPFGPGEGQEQEQREMPRRVRSFAPHGPPSGPGSGSATPITSGIGYHRRGPRTAAREVGGVVTWGGGGAPLFVKAGELFRDGEVDVVKRQGDIFIVEHLPLSDPSAPQMHDLHDDVEVDVVDPATSVKVLSAVAAHRHETGEHDDDVADDEVIERMLSDHIQMLAVDDSHSVAMETAIFVEHEEIIAYSPSGPVEDSHAIVAETAIIVEHEEIVPYSPSAPVGVLGTSTNPLLVDGGEEENVHAMPDDDLFAIDTAGVGGMVEMADDDLFAIDTTGAAPGIQILYDAPTQLPLAPKAPPKPTIEEETIIFQPRIIEDPVASSSRAARPATDFELTRVPVDPRIMMSRKERKKAKKEKRSRNKRARRKIGGGNGDLHLASDGSDLDWGSDGPPKILSAAAGDPVGDEELDPELDDETLARYLAGTERIREDNAAMAYMDSESDEWDDEDMEVTRRELAARPDTDSEDDSDDESTENDFNALADAYSEDEFASDGEAKMFSGVTKWNDSDDDEAAEIDDDNAWFIDSMEAALDGGAMAQSRKERKAVFRAVANGSFDTDFPLAPAKRNKKAPTHLPQELQDQWARDRAKKADKKRERELQRAIALLDPSIGFGRKANKKGKGKGKAAAARIAHLIPGSAAEVAELFDISDDEADPTKGWGIKYHRSNPLLPPTLGDVDLMIQDFLSDAGRTTLQLPPMDKETRKKVHMLAECYDLKSKSKGKGVGRFPILIKLARSGMDVNAAKRDRLVAAGQLNGGSFYKALYARKSKREGEGKNKFARGTGASVRAREGDLVGEGAEKIGEDNVGHKLLSKMGWSEGVTIGISGGVRGLETPIVAVVKNTKRGLGSYGMGYGPGPSGYSSGAAH